MGRHYETVSLAILCVPCLQSMQCGGCLHPGHQSTGICLQVSEWVVAGRCNSFNIVFSIQNYFMGVSGGISVVSG